MRGDDIAMGDLADAVEDGRLEIRKGQVQIAKYQGGGGKKSRSEESAICIGFRRGSNYGPVPIKTERKSRMGLNY